MKLKDFQTIIFITNICLITNFIISLFMESNSIFHNMSKLFSVTLSIEYGIWYIITTNSYLLNKLKDENC